MLILIVLLIALQNGSVHTYSIQNNQNSPNGAHLRSLAQYLNFFLLHNPSQYPAIAINGNIDIKGFCNSNKRLPPVRLDDLKLYQDHYIKILMLILVWQHCHHWQRCIKCENLEWIRWSRVNNILHLHHRLTNPGLIRLSITHWLGLCGFNNDSWLNQQDLMIKTYNFTEYTLRVKFRKYHFKVLDGVYGKLSLLNF